MTPLPRLDIFQPDPTRNDIRIVSDDKDFFYFVISLVRRTRQFLAYEGSPQITKVNALKQPIRYKITIKVKDDVNPDGYIRGLYRVIDNFL